MVDAQQPKTLVKRAAGYRIVFGYQRHWLIIHVRQVAQPAQGKKLAPGRGDVTGWVMQIEIGLNAMYKAFGYMRPLPSSRNL